MQTPSLVRNLRFTGLVIGFLAFAITTVHWIQYSTNVQVVQNSSLMARSK